MAVSELTLAELRYKHAQLVREAAVVEGRWRRMPTGPRAVATGKRLRDLKQRADDYAAIIVMILYSDLEEKLEASRG